MAFISLLKKPNNIAIFLLLFKALVVNANNMCDCNSQVMICTDLNIIRCSNPIHTLIYKSTSLNTLVIFENITITDKLDISFGNLSGIYYTPASLRAIKHLTINNNALTRITEDDFSLFYNLATLKINSNFIEVTEDDAFVDKQLIRFEAKNNLIDNIRFLKDQNILEHIDLSTNNIEEIDTIEYNLHNLKELNLAHNDIQSLPIELINGGKLKYLNLNHNCINNLNFLKNQTNIVELHLSYNNITSIQEITNYNLKSLTRLDISSNDIKYITNDLFEMLPKLTEINLSNNGINILEFKNIISKNIHYISIDLSNNKLSTIPINFFKNIKLENIALNNNMLTSLNFFNNQTSLKSIAISYNNLNQFDISKGLKNLQNLDVSNNELQYILMESIATIAVVNLSHNSIDVVHFTELNINIKEIDLSYNDIDYLDLNLLKHSQIESLYLSNNKLWALDFLKLGTSLRILDVSSNEINGESNLSNLHQLEELDLSNNDITSLNGLTSLTKLKKIDLSNNSLVDLNDLPLDNMEYSIKLAGNNVSCKFVNKLLKRNIDVQLDEINKEQCNELILLSSIWLLASCIVVAFIVLITIILIFILFKKKLCCAEPIYAEISENTEQSARVLPSIPPSRLSYDYIKLPHQYHYVQSVPEQYDEEHYLVPIQIPKTHYTYCN